MSAYAGARRGLCRGIDAVNPTGTTRTARRPSPAPRRASRGIVYVETKGYKQDGTLVCVFRRKVMVPKKEYAAAAVPDGVDPERPSFPEPR